MQFQIHGRGTLQWVDEFIVDRVQTVFHRALIVTAEFDCIEFTLPAFLAIFLDIIVWRAFVFRQVAQKRKDDAVFFLDRVTVDLCTGRWLRITE